MLTVTNFIQHSIGSPPQNNLAIKENKGICDLKLVISLAARSLSSGPIHVHFDSLGA